MYSFEGRIRYSECGENKKLKLPGLVDYFQDCSTFQAEAMGIGLQHVDEMHAGWILASWQIRIDRLPQFGEQVTTATWPYRFDKVFGFRNFTMRDESGALLACADSYWIYFDLALGRMVRIPPDIRDAYAKETEPPLPMEQAPRKIALPEGMTPEEPFSISAFDMDTNHHVNNGRYVHFAADYLPQDVQVGTVRVEYCKAAVLGDRIYPFVRNDGKEMIVKLAQEDGKPFATVQFCFA